MSRALGYLWAANITFILTVMVCVLLQPSNIWGHEGFSFYGNFMHTIVPYSIGLCGVAYCVARAGQALRDTEAAQSFYRGLMIIALAIVGIVVTPSLSGLWLVQDLHVVFGLVVFMLQALLSLHYLRQGRGGMVDWLLLVLQWVGIVVVALSLRLIGVVALMLPGQVLSILAFDALLIRAVRQESYRAPAAPENQ